MTNTLLCGTVAMICGIVGVLLGVAIPLRPLVEPGLWLAIAGGIVGACAPFVGMMIAVGRRVFR